jgi:hypothetical protein
MRAALVCALALAMGCSDGDEKKPTSTAGANDAGAKPADTAKRKPADAGANPAEQEGRAFLDRWLKAQNQGDFAAYSALYAPAFAGVRRSGKSAKKFDRDGWLADRKRMFAETMIVSADNPVVKADGDKITIDFEQTWESGSYADKGPKRIVLAAGLIASEEMLASTLKVVPAAGCAEALVPDAADRKQIRDTQVFAPAGSKHQVCIVEKLEEGAGEYQVGLLARRGKGWVVRGESRSFAFERKAAEGDDGTDMSAEIKATLVSIAPAEQALLVEVTTTANQDFPGGSTIRKSQGVLFRVVDQLDAMVEASSESDSSDEVDEGTRFDIDVSDHLTRGYYDVVLTVTTYSQQWAVDKEEESDEETRHVWDGSTYVPK